MQRKDLIALGFMTFALFLGAGNIIYPPILGQQAGSELLFAAVGFLLTAVGLPLLALVAMALTGGSREMTELLPKQWSRAFWLILFIAFGPALVIPRVAVVAYEMGMVPFLDTPQAWQLALYSGVFFALALLLALKPGAMINAVGRWVTPALIVLLCAIAWGTLSHPQDMIHATTMAAPLSDGLVQGYMTMDCIAALGFGAVIGQAIRQLGISEPKAMARYTIYAAIIAAIGLSLVYLMLMYLGATSHSIAPNATNGGQILALYVAALFGLPGKLLLALTITLACLTTAVGVGSACAHYFSSEFKLNYAVALVGVMLVSAITANIGLTQLIAISAPAVVTLYPLAVALVILALVRHKLPNALYAYRIIFPVVALFALLDGAKAAGLLAESSIQALEHWLPLFSQGMGWLIPFMVTLAFAWLSGYGKRSIQVA
ncbi:branched-chain amino acid transport system II carrier protein [Kistimonas scapharcae]|uniref:Branched-chain amino acid transport system carrier protein n=1 Tax=Kistimonas scapharcae TaxID=1036133 RepID=A0ABP8V3C0_9GAMM